MHPRALVAIALVAVAVPADAGPIEGKLTLPSGGAPRPPLRSKGFLEPIDNPYLPVKAPTPFPRMAIVLEGPAAAGGAAAAPASPPPQVAWDVLGDSFARPLLAVRIGTEIKITNRGHGMPILAAVGQPALIAKKPLNPSGEVVFNVGTTPGVIEIVDETTPHLRGRVLVTASTQLALPDAAGKFSFADAPPGPWTLRVFYDTGWVDRTDDKLTVAAGKATVNPALPPGLPVKAP